MPSDSTLVVLKLKLMLYTPSLKALNNATGDFCFMVLPFINPLIESLPSTDCEKEKVVVKRSAITTRVIFVVFIVLYF